MTTQPTPLNWRRVADTLDELDAFGESDCLTLDCNHRVETAKVEGLRVYHAHWGITHWMPIPPLPAPAPTEAELVENLVEAAVNNRSEMDYISSHKLLRAVDALLAHRAAKGGA